MSISHLLLWRHAEAEEGYPDEQRNLTDRGGRQAKAVARWLDRHLPQPCRVLVSPAQRTQQTVQAYIPQAETRDALGTSASIHDLLRVTGWPNNPLHATTLIVGHQPTLGQVAALLLTGEPALWSIRKGALWWLTQRIRQGQHQIVLRTIVDPEFLP